MKKLSFLVLVLILLVPTAALSQDAPNKYFVGKFGMFSPTGDLDDADYDAGYNTEAAFGFLVNPNFATEFGIGYFKSEADYSGVAPVIGAYTETDTVSVIPVTATLKGIHPFEKGDIYVGAGLGIYFVDIEADANTQNFGSISFSDNDEIFGFHLLAGINFNLTDRMFLGIEGKHIWTEDAEGQFVFNGVPFELEGNINGFIFTGNIGFRF